MNIFVQILGLVAACAASGVESSGSHDHGDSSGWHAPALDYSNLAGNGHFLAGLSQNYQALSHGQEGGQTFEHDVSQPAHAFGQNTGHGYDSGNQGQSKSFDVGSQNAFPSFAASGHDFTGDTYLQAAHDFGNHDQGVYNAYAGDLNSQGGNDHGDSNSHSDGEESNGHSDESYGQTGSAGYSPVSAPAHGAAQSFILHDGGNEYGHGGQGAIVHDLGVHGLSGHDFGGQYTQEFAGGLDHAEPFTVGEHTDEQKPVEVPLYKHVTVPVQKLIHVNVPKPILVGVPQPYPVKVPVNKPVAVPVETEISIPIEKVVPYPVVKHVPYPVEKHVPFKVEKTVHVHVPQPYPVKVPIYKTIHHHKDH
ncbi:filaggrin-2-like [Cydia strobilella]|uniref:filaggrin-2-like n=1 Tax=Cydia strobilella TaxID=1100964 RepID=UPI003006F479